MRRALKNKIQEDKEKYEILKKERLLHNEIFKILRSNKEYMRILNDKKTSKKLYHNILKMRISNNKILYKEFYIFQMYTWSIIPINILQIILNYLHIINKNIYTSKLEESEEESKYLTGYQFAQMQLDMFTKYDKY